jgi:hypothetical protein
MLLFIYGFIFGAALASTLWGFIYRRRTVETKQLQRIAESIRRSAAFPGTR